MMFSKNNRTKWDDTKLGFIFGFFGGFNNAAAITILFYEIAPMSANWGGMAKEIGRFDYVKVFTFLSLILCFITGAYIGARWVKKHAPTPIVIAESILLMSIALFARDNAILAIAIGGMAMGLQNGMTTQLSHHAVRTSHLTSTVTDIGIALAKKDYGNALVRGSKTLTYMWGALMGVLKASLLGPTVFALGGVYLLTIMLIHALLPQCASCLRRDALLEDWFAQVVATLSGVPTER